MPKMEASMETRPRSKGNDLRSTQGNSVYVGTDNRHIYRLSANSGEILGDVTTDATPYGHLILAGDSVLVFSRQRCCELQSGLEEAAMDRRGLQGLDFRKTVPLA